MPIEHKKLRPDPPGYTALVVKLEDELAGRSTTGPKIVEEEQFSNRLHVKVIWDAWKDLAPEERGRAIMDAYERVRPADVLRITIALGVTPSEAGRLGVAV
jgi:hypothetical protein